MNTTHLKKDLTDLAKKNLSKVPVEFIVGAALGGGVFLFATRKSSVKAARIIVKAAKLAAPYVITAIVEKFALDKTDKKNRVIEDAEVVKE